MAINKKLILIAFTFINTIKPNTVPIEIKIHSNDASTKEFTLYLKLDAQSTKISDLFDITTTIKEALGITSNTKTLIGMRTRATMHGEARCWPTFSIEPDLSKWNDPNNKSRSIATETKESFGLDQQRRIKLKEIQIDIIE